MIMVEQGKIEEDVLNNLILSMKSRCIQALQKKR